MIQQPRQESSRPQRVRIAFTRIAFWIGSNEKTIPNVRVVVFPWWTIPRFTSKSSECARKNKMNSSLLACWRNVCSAFFNNNVGPTIPAPHYPTRRILSRGILRKPRNRLPPPPFLNPRRRRRIALNNKKVQRTTSRRGKAKLW
jgi:hypothetical protein